MLYGKNYVYRSGFSKSMVNNPDEKVRNIQNQITLNQDGIIVVTDSNDGTLL